MSFLHRDVARDMVLAANQAGGASFWAGPLVEATGSRAISGCRPVSAGVDEETAFHAAVRELAGRLRAGNGRAHPPGAGLPCSQRSTSNTPGLLGAGAQGPAAGDGGGGHSACGNGTVPDW